MSPVVTDLNHAHRMGHVTQGGRPGCPSPQCPPLRLTHENVSLSSSQAGILFLDFLCQHIPSCVSPEGSRLCHGHPQTGVGKTTGGGRRPRPRPPSHLQRRASDSESVNDLPKVVRQAAVLLLRPGAGVPTVCSGVLRRTAWALGDRGTRAGTFASLLDLRGWRPGWAEGPSPAV